MTYSQAWLESLRVSGIRVRCGLAEMLKRLNCTPISVAQKVKPMATPGGSAVTPLKRVIGLPRTS
jgi:hypothetical protein